MPIVIPPASFIPSRYGAVVLAELTEISRLPVTPCIGLLPKFSHGIHVLGKQFRSRSAGSTGGWIRLLHVTAVLTTLPAL